MNVADTSNETTLTCELDIEALRKRRARPYMDKHASSMNFLAELNTAAHAPIFEQYATWPADHWLEHPIRSGAENHALISDVIRQRIDAGLQVPPSED